jgi:hypothetical protein
MRRRVILPGEEEPGSGGGLREAGGAEADARGGLDVRRGEEPVPILSEAFQQHGEPEGEAFAVEEADELAGQSPGTAVDRERRGVEDLGDGGAKVAFEEAVPVLRALGSGALPSLGGRSDHVEPEPAPPPKRLQDGLEVVLPL